VTALDLDLLLSEPLMIAEFVGGMIGSTIIQQTFAAAHFCYSSLAWWRKRCFFRRPWVEMNGMKQQILHYPVAWILHMYLMLQQRLAAGINERLSFVISSYILVNLDCPLFCGICSPIRTTSRRMDGNRVTIFTICVDFVSLAYE